MLCVSLSIALKIQVSGATADLLHALRGYILMCRGTLNVKVILHYLYVEKSSPLDTLVVEKRQEHCIQCIPGHGSCYSD